MQVNGKALFLTLASSGMRIGECLKLQIGDFDFTTQPCKVSIRGEYTKTGNSRVAFISREAVEAVQEWLKVRAKYIEGAANKSNGALKKRALHAKERDSKDERMFPYLNNTAYAIWKNALKKSGFLKHDASTDRLTIHPHVLRKFFRTKLGAVIPVDIAEALMGHEGYLTEVYRKYSVEDLAKFYLQGEPTLMIFTDAEEVGRLRVEVEERNKQLQTLANGLATENMELKSRMAKVEVENTELKKRFLKTEEKFMQIEKTIQDLKKTVES
jgi:integrase